MMTSTPNTTKDRKEHECRRYRRKIRTAMSTKSRIKPYTDNYVAVYQHEAITRILLHLSFEYNMLSVKTLKACAKLNLDTEQIITLLNSYDIYHKNYGILYSVEKELFERFNNALEGEMLDLDEIIQRLREKGLSKEIIENFTSRVSYYL